MGRGGRWSTIARINRGKMGSGALVEGRSDEANGELWLGNEGKGTPG